ncbi:recombination mediator RecR [Ruminococcus sp.]|uniref:recombination mediator RecR n=1 Tax=Ruminococcus sp. TaxID=41978 RepID=UPI0025D71381|nr:recombination mediator RecR [Ruminococcus sp.]
MPGYNALPLELLAEEFAKLPGIGIKSAQRLAYSIISRPQEEVKAFADALLAAKRDIHYCPCCQNLTDLKLCPICADGERDKTTVCVVEGPKDVSALERIGEYNGVYHVLHGLISPIDGITPDKLRIRELLARLNQGEIREVIMATNPTVEGDATAMYLAQLLEPLGVKVTRLAFGLPVGGTLEYADEVTLFKALENRTAM